MAERGEAVFDVGWDHIDDGAFDESVGFHAAQGLGEHLLRDPLVAICQWAMDHLAELQIARQANTRVTALS